MYDVRIKPHVSRTLEGQRERINLTFIWKLAEETEIDKWWLLNPFSPFRILSASLSHSLLGPDCIFVANNKPGLRLHIRRWWMRNERVYQDASCCVINRIMWSGSDGIDPSNKSNSFCFQIDRFQIENASQSISKVNECKCMNEEPYAIRIGYLMYHRQRHVCVSVSQLKQSSTLNRLIQLQA